MPILLRNLSLVLMAAVEPTVGDATVAEIVAETAAWPQAVRRAVLGLGYPEAVAQDFAGLVRDWKLAALQQELRAARKQQPPGGPAPAQAAEVEARVVRELSRTVRQQLNSAEGAFELADVVRSRQADCLGFSQVFYVIGEALGLSPRAIQVSQLSEPGGELPPGASHVACLVALADGTTLMVDLATAGPALISVPFVWDKTFRREGNFWELNPQLRAAGIHRRVRRLEREGLIACVYENRGNRYNKVGQHAQALEVLAQAIQLDPRGAGAYSNRGIAEHRLGKVKEAITDYTRAVQLDPKFGEAYYNRGNVYATLGEFQGAITDYSRAIELNARYAWAFTNRGNAHFALGRIGQAIADHTRAIQLDPKLAEAYSNRGNAYKSEGKFSEAVADHTQAIRLDPAIPEFYLNRAIALGRLGRSNEVQQDLRKAVELEPGLRPRAEQLARHFGVGL